MMSRLMVAVGLSLILQGCSRAPQGAQPGNTTPVPVISSPDTRPRVENPKYRRWADYKPGTKVVLRETTVSSDKTAESISTFLLKSVAEDKVVVEVSGEIVMPDGSKMPTEPQELVYSQLIPEPKKGEDLSQPEGTTGQRKENVTVLGKEYPATCYTSKGRVEAGETITETWLTDKIPGGMAKSVHKIPAAKKSITVEIVEIKIPN